MRRAPGTLATSLSIALTLAGCSRPSPPGGAASASSTTFSDPATSSVPAPSTTLAPSGGRDWIVRVRGIQGDCAPDATSCDQRYEAGSDGSWVRHLEPHPLAKGGKAVTTTRTLSEADLTALRAIVESSSFEEEMTNGFACQGGKKDHHYTWRITFLADDRERVQHAEYCISGKPEDTNTPRKLLELLER